MHKSVHIIKQVKSEWKFVLLYTWYVYRFEIIGQAQKVSNNSLYGNYGK